MNKEEFLHLELGKIFHLGCSQVKVSLPNYDTIYRCDDCCFSKMTDCEELLDMSARPYCSLFTRKDKLDVIFEEV